MIVYIVISWGVDDIPIGIFDDYKLAKKCAEENNTGVYEMTINEIIDRKEFFKRIVKKERNK